MRRALLVFVFAVVSFPGAAWPQGQPVGPEFGINTYTTGVQGQPVAAMDPSGRPCRLPAAVRDLLATSPED